MFSASYELARLKINDELARAERERLVRSAGGRSGFFVSIGTGWLRERLGRFAGRPRTNPTIAHSRPAGA